MKNAAGQEKLTCSNVGTAGMKLLKQVLAIR